MRNSLERFTEYIRYPSADRAERSQETGGTVADSAELSKETGGTVADSVERSQNTGGAVADSAQRSRRPASKNADAVSKILELTLEGGSASSCFPVSDFAQLSIAAAVNEVQRLCRTVWNVESAARVDRMLASRWFDCSVYPEGWNKPATWDAFAGDYQTCDGWIRLHTNAPHHRQAALRVLDDPDSKPEAAQRVAVWQGSELESAVVAAGGAAAVMLGPEQWQAHPQGQAVNDEPVVAWQELRNAKSTADLLRKATASRPLRGVRVLDLTRVLAGPVATRFLASLGADVLRIDPPEWEEDGNALEMTLGKRCAGLDLHQSRDRAIFERLLASANVIVHGYRRDALSGLGFDEQARAALNPNLIDVALNAYGWSGPWTVRRGFDSLVQMSSGIACTGMRQTGADKPVPLPFQALDHATGYLLAATVVHAITRRASSGLILSARLSLARQAKLLQDLRISTSDGESSDSERDTIGSSMSGDGLVLMDESHFMPEIENTPWGPLRRLRLPYAIDDVDLRFDHAVSRLRSVEAKWA